MTNHHHTSAAKPSRSLHQARRALFTALVAAGLATASQAASGTWNGTNNNTWVDTGN